ncbi:MAG: protein translocase subunit SecD [Actinomycetaceae bacterium]|nr:protein translocase subunit SecD [Actinomycetaceae bacterium]
MSTLFVGTAQGEKTRFLPELALDLEGGTQIILTPATTDGSEITQDDVNQAIEIIRQRVDASGVAEAEISAQGGSNIIVALPGQPDQETLDLVRTSAVLRMRPVLADADPLAITPQAVAEQLALTGVEVDPATMTDAELDEAIRLLADTDGDGVLSDTPATQPANASDQAWITEQVLYEVYTTDCGSQEQALAAAADDPDRALVSCDLALGRKYILGPAEIEGTSIDSASSGQAVNSAGQPTGGWAVNMEFDSEGAQVFYDVTGRISQLPPPQNQFAIVLDGQTVSAPATSGPIAGGQAQITGSFTAEEAATLANQLKFGSLPLFFDVQSEEQISATLGTEQLRSGLIAGLVGFLLIALYMLWQYHGLGIVAMASITMATGMSFFLISLLSWTMGYRLSMAGVLGIIISIGVTADSFIVYFERIRDEIRDGRTVPSAIEHGWERARRTIIISDFVNLVAAVVLYMLTVGSVRGFAFTLGLTTVLDLIVVMMFTYPVMHYLGKRPFFGQGKAGSGLNTAKLEQVPVYRGRGMTRSSEPKKPAKARSGYRALTPGQGTGSGEEVELHDYEFPDERFTDPELVAQHRSGESLAKRRARERREARARAQADQQGGDE